MSSTARHEIAFIGLGHMGGPMATNLVKAGHHVRAFDLVPELLEIAARNGATVAGSAIEAAAGADVVITMLPGGAHVLGVYTGEDGLLATLAPETLVIDSSTIDVFDARSFHEAAAAANVVSVDAPVSGGVVGAEAATLTFMVGGTDAAYARAKPILEVMGKKLVHCGDAASGQAAKLCNNMLLGISMIGVSEAFALADKLGLSHQAFFDVASTSSGRCWSLDTNCPVPGMVTTSPANNDYRPGFSAALMLKDLRLARAAADAAGAATELGHHATEIYERFSDEAAATTDFSGVYRLIAEQATSNA
ncbi:MAG: 3-hydroxyisobutyrate dehydrogenase [Thermoleophilia bacterium]|nr:3-hydroxyisobutyrate dehydrogenase [Thermoleophilia bacterium]